MSGQNWDLDGEETVGVLESLAGVAAKEVEWLWPGRIAAGCLTLVAGDEGVGKSLVTLDLAARVTRGGLWPDGQGDGVAGGVLLVTAENHREYSVLPMLEAARADVEMIRVWSRTLTKRKSKESEGLATSSRPVNLAQDLDVLATMIEKTPDCRLVVIDPIGSFLGKNSSELMNSLIELAERTGVAIVGVTNLKSGGQEALQRVVGGQTLTAAARAVWLVTRERKLSVVGCQLSDEGETGLEGKRQESGDRGQGSEVNKEGGGSGGRRLFLPIKNNLTWERTGLALELTRREGMTGPRVAWSSAAVEMTADDALQRLRRRPGSDPVECERAEEFLRAALVDGGRPVKDVEEEAREVHGIRLDTLRQARKNLKVKAYREGNRGAWWVRLREEDAEGEKLSVAGCQLSEESEQRAEVEAEVGLRQSSGHEMREGEVDGQMVTAATEGMKRDWQVGKEPHSGERQDLQCLEIVGADLQDSGGLARDPATLTDLQCLGMKRNERTTGAGGQHQRLSWKKRKKMKRRH